LPDVKPQKIAFDSTTKALFGRLFRDYIVHHRWRIGAAVLCMIVVAAATGGLAQLMDPVISRIFDAQQSEMLLPVAMAALAIFVAKGLATYGQAVLMSQVGLRIVADLQIDLFKRLQKADLAFFTETAPGALVARFINDINMLSNTVSRTVTSFGKDILTLLALVAVMFYQDWLLAVIAFFAFPTAIFPIARIGKRLRKVSRVTQQEVGTLSTFLDENFQGARQVKAYAMEDYERGRAEQRIDEVFRLRFKGARVRNLVSPLMEILGGLAVVAVILFGGKLVIEGVKEPGSLAAFLTALLLAYEPAKRLAKLNASLQEGLAAAHRVFELMDRKPEIVDSPTAKPLVISGGEVRFDGVDFAYLGAKAAALRTLTLSAPAGQTVALVGPSGAGKTTVLNLIPRFYDPTAGTVTIDGQDVREVTLNSLRRQVALVSQEILRLDDSVRANIAYGRPEATEQEIVEAARLAGAEEFIDALPEKYETMVGPRGAKLSGGQRQRIAIARALLKDAPVLLLDEATSALDSESERRVQEALGTLMRGRTTLVIAHRLSTVVDADIIYVMEDGGIVEQGSHEELLAKEGAYAQLYALQFAEEDEPRDPDGLRAQA
jgi:subfamily B ATP-binding cassette protein MsbA